MTLPCHPPNTPSYLQLTNYGTAKLASEASWRIPLSVIAGPALAILAWALFLPDSPGSLLSRGKQEAAQRTLEARGRERGEAPGRERERR
jgi:hypothetical protein